MRSQYIIFFFSIPRSSSTVQVPILFFAHICFFDTRVPYRTVMRLPSLSPPPSQSSTGGASSALNPPGPSYSTLIYTPCAAQLASSSLCPYNWPSVFVSLPPSLPSLCAAILLPPPPPRLLVSHAPTNQARKSKPDAAAPLPLVFCSGDDGCRRDDRDAVRVCAVRV